MAVEVQGDEIFDTGAESFTIQQNARRAVLEWLKNNSYEFHTINSIDEKPDAGILEFHRVKNESDQAPVVLVGLPSVFKNNPAITIESQTVNGSPQSTFTSVRTEIAEDDHIRMVVCRKSGTSNDFSFTSRDTNHVDTHITANIFSNGMAVQDLFASEVQLNVVFIGVRVSDNIHQDPVGSLDIRVPMELSSTL